MNDPESPSWGSWAGRYGPNDSFPGKPYYWANVADAWNGSTQRDNTVARWAADLQNNFRARADWCVKPFGAADHPPVATLNGSGGKGILRLTARTGSELRLSAAGSHDPDGHSLQHEWILYPEAGTYPGAAVIDGAGASEAALTPPRDAAGKSFHVILRVKDGGEPPLAAYRRAVIHVLDGGG